ncbi:MAG: DUF3853 family protein [Bacteroides sp.]|nr:DUF3853 family protein [Bacteroides sp.]
MQLVRGNIVRGNKDLAKHLQVSVRTIGRWKSDGLLSEAIVGQMHRVILYDLDKVLKCMNHYCLPASKN